MLKVNFGDKLFFRQGSVGFPRGEVIGEELLHDGKRVKKLAQLVVIHHNDGAVKYTLKIDEYTVNRDSTVEPKSHIFLDELSTEKLFNYLMTREQFAEIAQTTFYTVAESTSPLDNQTIEQLSTLVRRAVKNQQITRIVPSDIALNFGAIVQQIRYKKAVDELASMLKVEHSEHDYKVWFLNNSWVFGTEYLRTEKVKIGWRTSGDIIMTSTDGYQDIIELKLPTEEMFCYDDSHKNWYPSSALSKAISQTIKYIQKSEDSRLNIKAEEKVPFLKPRAKIVIGRSTDWDQDGRDCLRKLNAALQNIQVMTYDHLLSSAQQMLSYYEGIKNKPENSGEPKPELEAVTETAEQPDVESPF